MKYSQCRDQENFPDFSLFALVGMEIINPSCCLLLEQMPEGLEAITFQMSMVFEDNPPSTRKLLDGAVAFGFTGYLVKLLWAEQIAWTFLTD